MGLEDDISSFLNLGQNGLFSGGFGCYFQGVRVLFELFHTRNWIIKRKLSNMIFLSTKTTVVMYTAYIFGWGIRFLNVFFEKTAF